jgi:small subunit ribosomal protein S1
MSSRREYIIGSTFEGIIKCVKSYGTFIDIGDDVGLLHISEISHVRVTSMEALFAPGEKIKVMILNQDKTKGHLKLSTKQLETKPGDMLHVQAYQKAKENASMLTSSIIQHEQGTMEENLIENEDNAMNKGFPNLLIREKLNQNQIPSYINKAYVIIC